MIEVIIAIVFLILASLLGYRLRERWTTLTVCINPGIQHGDYITMNGQKFRVVGVRGTNLTIE